jgi:osmoprotectant transport system substrate-binding protein
LLLFLTNADSSVATQAAPAVGALKIVLATHGATVLDPAPAIDGDVFAVTRATATTYHLTTLSSLTAVAGQLVLGGPPACPQLPRCEPGLQNTYGMHFASFTALDDAGPITVSALQGGEVQVAELRSTDSSIVQHDFVVLADDRHLQPADNLVPVIRRSVDTPAIAGALNRLSARLTTAELAQLTRAVDIDGDPGAVALRWLRHEHLR